MRLRAAVVGSLLMMAVGCSGPREEALESAVLKGAALNLREGPSSTARAADDARGHRVIDQSTRCASALSRAGRTARTCARARWRPRSARVWVVPGTNTRLSTGSHPYSTYHFENEYHGWHAAGRGSVKRADAMVYNDGGGHIFIYGVMRGIS